MSQLGGGPSNRHIFLQTPYQMVNDLALLKPSVYVDPNLKKQSLSYSIICSRLGIFTLYKYPKMKQLKYFSCHIPVSYFQYSQPNQMELCSSEV